MGSTSNLSSTMSLVDHSGDYDVAAAAAAANSGASDSGASDSDAGNLVKLEGTTLLPCQLLPCHRDLAWRLANCHWLQLNSRSERNPIFTVNTQRKPIRGSGAGLSDAVFELFEGRPLINIEIINQTIYCYPVRWQLTALSYELRLSRVHETRSGFHHYVHHIKDMTEAAAVYYAYLDRPTGDTWLTFVDYNKDWTL